MFNFKKKIAPVTHNSFFRQNILVKKADSRLDVFRQYCSGNSVLHFGCTDYPVFNPDYNLHIHLNTYVDELYGFDIDEPGIEILKKYVDKPYFSTIDEVLGKHFNVCLVPETIEHVDNIQLFLSSIAQLNCDTFIITGPNCFAPQHIERNTWDGNTFTEIVHADHNCWFSAYTLNNVVKKYTNLTPVETWLMDGETMVCVIYKK